MKNINEAPKDRVILLYVPEFGASAATWWPGLWSWIENKWSIRTPLVLGGKMFGVSDIPDPVGWENLPDIDFLAEIVETVFKWNDFSNRYKEDNFGFNNTVFSSEYYQSQANTNARHQTEKTDRMKAPWKDIGGNDLFVGDLIRHPAYGPGSEGVIFFMIDKIGIIDQWNVVYPDGSILRLCLQIGEKGRAVKVVWD